MNGVNSNHVNHPLSHGRSSNIVNIPYFHLFGHAPHLLMCYALDLDPEMCYAPYSNLDPKIGYAPYSNSDPKMYCAPNPDLEICHAFDLDMRYTPILDLGNVSCTKSGSRNVSCIRSKMCYAPNLDFKMCHAPNLDLRNMSYIRSKMCYAPNLDFKMCHAPNPDLKICYASHPECVMHQIHNI
jgi:hypothetical protein